VTPNDAPVQFIDQTMRDGPQSHWGMRLHPDMVLPIAPLLDRAGFKTLDVVGSSIFEIQVRHLRVDPWQALDDIVAACPRTPIRAGTRSNGMVSFGLTADEVMDLWVGRLCAHGVRSFWIYDGLFNIDKMERLAKVAMDAGAEVAPCILFARSPYHTDEYYADITARLAALEGLSAIEFEDAAGVLEPERVRGLLPKMIAAAGDVPLEVHFHTNTGLAQLCYLEALNAGVRIIHTVTRPLANGPSLPSSEAMRSNVLLSGYRTDLDDADFPEIAAQIERVAETDGLPIGHANEYEVATYEHQLPGGMTGTMRNQLAERGEAERLPEVLEEMGRVRQELGYPVMATPFSQLVGTQAVLNVIGRERYELVPEEVVVYVNGHYGEPAAPIDPDVMDRIQSTKRAKEMHDWEPPQPTLAELRAQFGEVDDDELLLRLVVPEHFIDRVRDDPAPRRDYGLDNQQLRLVRELLRSAPGEHLNVEADGITITLEGRKR
jgi:oxaloacetate decarboxylase (Na+ extruding) subunit alpha